MFLAPSITLFLAFTPAAAPPPGAMFNVGDQEADHAMLTVGESIGQADHSTPMLRLLDGGVAELDSRGLNQFRAATRPEPPAIHDPAAHRFAFVHLQAKSATRILEIVANSDGTLVLRDPAAPPSEPAAVRIDREKFMALAFPAADPWPLYRGTDLRADGQVPPTTGQPSVPQVSGTGVVLQLDKPFTPSWFVLDKPTLSTRFLHGRETQIPREDRILDDEKFFVRLPKGYTPESPAGLLVWISATEDGRPPGVFDSTLDSLNIVCIGAANCGNARSFANRCQVALDALATASERFHIDPRRVYVSGISGGGRVSTTLAACFPDVFAGAVGIVGLSCYENVPAAGNGRSFVAGYSRPPPRLFDLLKTRRIAVITGQKDFNHPEILMASQIMRGDGLNVKAFEHVDMGHEMPTPEHFDEAMRWIDEPWRTARAAEVVEADRLLKSYTDRFGDKPAPAPSPTSAAQRAELARVTQAGPWTPAAWEAVRRLDSADKP